MTEPGVTIGGPAGKSTVVREASEWFATIQATPDLPADTLQAWLRWLEASAENRRAFENVARIWHGTNAAVIAQPDDAQGEQDYDGSISVQEWRANKRKTSTNLRAPPWRGLAAGEVAASVLAAGNFRGWRRRRPLLVAAAAAAITLSALIALRGIDFLLPSAAISAGRFATRTGEHSELVLADGSRVTLGGQSRLAVHFTPTVRAVRLESGEAYFSVHKDPARPFNVLALNGVITAVGTAFNVRAIEDRVTVTVTEGAVSVADDTVVSRSRAAGPEAVGPGTVRSGQEIVYRSARTLTVPQPLAIKQVDPAESVRWRSGWLMYHNEPLRYVIADIGRYTDLKLSVSGAAADLQFSGAIYKDRIAEWVVALPEVSPVTLTKDAGQLTIQPRD